MPKEIERVCTENELVINAWSPIHLKTKLKELYWKPEQPAAGAMAFWEDSLRYLNLPRLKERDVLAKAIRTGAASRDFFGTAYGQHDGKFDGFHLGSGDVQLDDTLLLIEPEAAAQYEASQVKAVEAVREDKSAADYKTSAVPPQGDVKTVGESGATRGPRTFRAAADVSPAVAKMRMAEIADEIISVLVGDPNAVVKVVVEISAEFPNGAKDGVRRAVSENAQVLGMKNADWE